jgi:hypothetical protein
VDTVRSLDDRHLNQQLDIRRRRKKRAQGNDVSLKKLNAGRRRVIRRAVPAVHKGNMRKKPGNEITARKIPESRAASVTTEAKPEFNTRIDDRVARKQLQPAKERTSDRVIMKPIKRKRKKVQGLLQM